jgi:hypothetical protein
MKLPQVLYGVVLDDITNGDINFAIKPIHFAMSDFVL